LRDSRFAFLKPDSAKLLSKHGLNFEQGPTALVTLAEYMHIHIAESSAYYLAYASIYPESSCRLQRQLIFIGLLIWLELPSLIVPAI